MSFLRMLYADSDSENVEEYLWSDSAKDDECVKVLDDVESKLLIANDEISNLQLLKHVESLEVKSQFLDVTNLQLMNDVQIIESRFVK